MTISSSTRVGTPTNLSPGGSYDLLLVKFQGSFPEGEIKFGLYNTPAKITGVQKVAQIFLKILLTSKGSDPVKPDFGTLFYQYTPGANIVQVKSLLSVELAEVIADASRQTRAVVNVNNSDPSSCLESVTLLSVDEVPEGFVMYLEMKTQDGVGAAIAVPFPEFSVN